MRALRPHSKTSSNLTMARARFIVVVDRGIVKAYEVRQTPTHGATPRLVLETNFKEAHERYRDKVTDQAGAFPAAGSGGHGNAIAERTGMQAEEDARLFRSIAQQVEEIIRQYQPTTWSFAAPAEINSAILQRIPSDLHKILNQNVRHDLVKIPTDSLLQHFQ
jgi:hypothetical protein